MISSKSASLFRFHRIEEVDFFLSKSISKPRNAFLGLLDLVVQFYTAGAVLKEAGVVSDNFSNIFTNK